MKNLVWVLALAWIGTAAAQATSEPPRKFRGVLFKPAHDAENADRAAMQKMTDGLAAPYSGDPDHDFAVHIVPQLQGAVDLCQTELEYGAEDKLKQICKRIVAAHEADIRALQGWLAHHKARTVYDLPTGIQAK